MRCQAPVATSSTHDRPRLRPSLGGHDDHLRFFVGPSVDGRPRFEGDDRSKGPRPAARAVGAQPRWDLEEVAHHGVAPGSKGTVPPETTQEQEEGQHPRPGDPVEVGQLGLVGHLRDDRIHERGEQEGAAQHGGSGRVRRIERPLGREAFAHGLRKHGDRLPVRGEEWSDTFRLGRADGGDQPIGLARDDRPGDSAPVGGAPDAQRGQDGRPQARPTPSGSASAAAT